MYTNKRNENNSKSVVVKITRSVSFDSDCLSNQQKISKARARYIKNISSKALSIVND